MSGPLFPVVVKDDSFCPPEAPTYFVLAQNGLFLVRRSTLFAACVPAEGGVPGLQEHEASLSLNLPRLPQKLLERAVGFFREVYERWRGEALLMIFYAPPQGERSARFQLVAPPQLLRGYLDRGRFRAYLHLEYGACDRPGPEYVKLGTIHSHGEVGPAHSAVDAHDELYEAGLHITAGYVSSARPEFEAAFVVGRTRFSLSAESILPPFTAPRRPPPLWMEQVATTCRWRGGYRNWIGPAHAPGRRTVVDGQR